MTDCAICAKNGTLRKGKQVLADTTCYKCRKPICVQHRRPIRKKDRTVPGGYRWVGYLCPECKPGGAP